MNCPQCGVKNTEIAGFCIACGNPLAMAHIIRDEGYIEDLVYRIDRLEALIQELTGKPISQEAISPITKIDSEMDATPQETHLGAAEGVDSGGHGESSDLSESNAEIQSVDFLPERSGGQELQYEPLIIPDDPAPAAPAIGIASNSIASKVSRLDRDLGLNWLAIAGGIFIVTAVGLLSGVVLIAIAPLGKFVFSLSLGTVALILGEISRRKYGLLSDAITGSGLSIVYIATFASFALGDVIPDQLGFGVLLAISLLGWFLAVRADSVWVALLGTVGTFITPFILQGSIQVAIPVLMVIAYLVIADIAVALISLTKRWVLLKQISLWASYLFLFVVFAQESLGISRSLVDEEPLWVGIVSFSVIYGLFLCVSGSYHLIWKIQTDFRELLLVVGNSVLFYVALLTLLPDTGTYGFGIANISLALVNAAVSAVFWFRGGNREIQLLFGVKSAAFAMATVPVLLNGEIVTSVWAGMGLSVLVLGRYLCDVRWQLYSLILFGLSLGKFWIVDLWVSTDYELLYLMNDRLVTGIALSIILLLAWFACAKLPAPTSSLDTLSPTAQFAISQNSLQSVMRSFEVQIRRLFADCEPAIPRGLATMAFVTGLGAGMAHLGQTPFSPAVKQLYITWSLLCVGGLAFCLASVRKSHWFVLLSLGILSLGVVKMPVIDLVATRGVWVQGLGVTGYSMSTFIAVSILIAALIIFRRCLGQYTGSSVFLNVVSKWEDRFVPAALLLPCLATIYFGLGLELFFQWDNTNTGDAYKNVLLLGGTLVMALAGIGTIAGAVKLKDYANVQGFYRLAGFGLVMLALVKLLSADGFVAQGKGLMSNVGGEGVQFFPFFNIYIGTVVAVLLVTVGLIRFSRFEAWSSPNLDDSVAPIIAGIRRFGQVIGLSGVGAVLLVAVSREIMVTGLHLDVERMVLSVYWLIYALMVIALGIRWKMAKMRLIGFGFLIVPIAKTFLYDVWVINPLLGFVGLFVMGCLLLGMSFVYQRNRTRIQSFLFEDQETTLGMPGR